MLDQLSRLWRVFATGLSFLLFSAGAFVIGMLLTVFLYPLPVEPHRKGRLARAIVSRSAQLYVRCLKWLGLLTFEFVSFDSLETEGAIVVANHPTLLDAVFLMSRLPNATSVVKASMSTGIFTSRLMQLMEAIPNSIDGEGIIERSRKALNQGQTLFMFPEGTRTADFSALSLRRGAANIALAAGCDILPVFIDCQPLTLRKGSAWYQVPDVKPHFRFKAMDAIKVREYSHEDRSNALSARSLTAHIQQLLSYEVQKTYL